MEEKKKMERHDEKGRLAMAENNYGDNNKIEAQLTPLLGNSPAAKRTEFSTAPLFWGMHSFLQLSDLPQNLTKKTEVCRKFAPLLNT